jgi:hypothetical protein
MADRVSASIVIGGSLSASAYTELVELIGNEGLSTEWDGEAFQPHHRVAGEAVSLFAYEVPGGQFEELEAWCTAQNVPFARWSGGYSGQWGPERVLFDGTGPLRYYAVSEDDVVMIDQDTIERLGSFDSILAHFAAADFAVPPLVVEGDVLEAGVSTDSIRDVEGQPHVE